ncbi:hypothetical protein Pryu01_02458 [Paraliobacillus ryukyuensis]|uniref:S-formylglutathione hydrolase FrmB n=1 Tax=Paraliobacillus ryukyuensis TaxID=200904 RepID=A0A366DUG9_9BACI|nr:alpha/beta hydrolase family protein [Paraliobacillus ryukyuensis]RBO93555.1 S-formylglutathione hydrolase FrmB [Paraliobacillus ryukyuensis]
MTLWQGEFISKTLSRTMTMSVILPQEIRQKNYPTLYLLHGFSDNASTWMRSTSIERYALDKGLAVVMPSVDNSYYCDMVYGGDFWTYLTEEVLAISRSVFPLSEKQQNTFVAGNSMGGFGALKWGLNHPEKFAAIASLSGVTDMVTHLDTIRNETGIKKDNLFQVFGDNTIEGTENDIIALLHQLNQYNGSKPKIYQTCGTEDFLYPINQNFYQASLQAPIDLTSDFPKGDHSWEFWDEKIKDIIDWLPINR